MTIVDTDQSPAELDLVRRAASAIARPTVDQPDSFGLHAPLELAARHDLLPLVSAEARPQAIARIEELVAAYEALPSIDAPSAEAAATFGDAGHATSALIGTIGDGDADGADLAATWLIDHLAPAEVAGTVADLLLPALTAAGHGVIGLDRLARVSADDPVGATGVRMLAREAARQPGWRITWHEARESGATGSDRRSGARALAEALTAPPHPGPLESDFIYPLVDAVQRGGLAAETLTGPLAGLSVADAEPVLLRAASRSMLQDDPDKAPYGWTHCLTLPLGALGLAGVCRDRAAVVTVAATYVLAFRAVQGRVALDPTAVPGPRPTVAVPPAELVERTPAEAAAAVWHADESALLALVGALVDHAMGHEDAHLVKYTLACLRAAERDQGSARLHVAAAAHLGAWWGGDRG